MFFRLPTSVFSPSDRNYIQFVVEPIILRFAQQVFQSPLDYSGNQMILSLNLFHGVHE